MSARDINEPGPRTLPLRPVGTFVYARPATGKTWADFGLPAELPNVGDGVSFAPCLVTGEGEGKRVHIPGVPYGLATSYFEIADEVPSVDQAAEDNCRYSD